MKSLHDETIRDCLFSTRCKQELQERTAMIVTNSKLHADWGSGIVYGDIFIDLYPHEQDMRRLRKDMKGVRHLVPHPDILPRLKKFLSAKAELDSEVRYFAQYLGAVKNSFPHNEQAKLFVPESAWQRTGMNLFTFTEDIKSEEFIEQFKHINGKYLTEFKAQMLLNLIAGENHE